MIALIGMITALAGGATISAVLAGLSITDWLGIAGVLLSVGEEGIKLFTALHPSLKLLEADLMSKINVHDIANKAIHLKFSMTPDEERRWMDATGSAEQVNDA